MSCRVPQHGAATIRSQPDQDTVKVINNRLSSKVNSLEWYNHKLYYFSNDVQLMLNDVHLMLNDVQLMLKDVQLMCVSVRIRPTQSS